ncbi:hypothetical protein VPH35_082505 [Triticum aestivum]
MSSSLLLCSILPLLSPSPDLSPSFCHAGVLPSAMDRSPAMDLQVRGCVVPQPPRRRPHSQVPRFPYIQQRQVSRTACRCIPSPAVDSYASSLAPAPSSPRATGDRRPDTTPASSIASHRSNFAEVPNKADPSEVRRAALPGRALAVSFLSATRADLHGDVGLELDGPATAVNGPYLGSASSSTRRPHLRAPLHRPLPPLLLRASTRGRGRPAPALTSRSEAASQLSPSLKAQLCAQTLVRLRPHPLTGLGPWLQVPMIAVQMTQPSSSGSSMKTCSLCCFVSY